MGLPSIIVSIILSASLIGIATMYFGDIFGSSAAKAKATEVIKQAAEIKDSLRVYSAQNHGQIPIKSDGTGVDLQKLVDEDYVKDLPEGWSAYNDIRRTNDVSRDVCLEINKRAGIAGTAIPACADYPNGYDGATFFCCTGE